MQQIIPGSVIACEERFKSNAFSQIEPVFSLTGGLTLAQVRSITGLETSTIQNWVRRNWVQKPENKLYGKNSLLRIMIINSARGGIQIDSVAEIMKYVNGELEDTSDDIISEEQFFNIFCKTVFAVEDTDGFTEEEIKTLISLNLEDYEEKEIGAKVRLEKALLAVTAAYFAAKFKDIANRVFDYEIK